MTINNQQPIFIAGHKNPDTDSVCSAIAYAEFKKRQGISAVPVILGDINKETKFVLDYFEIQAPELLSTVKTQVSDLTMDIIEPVRETISVKSAWTTMRKNNVKVLPVIDKHEHFCGMVTLSDITSEYMDTADTSQIVLNHTPLRNIIYTLNATVLTDYNPDLLLSGRVLIAAMSPEEMSTLLKKGDVIITGNRKDSQIAALKLGVTCLIVTCNREVDKEVIDLAKANNCIIISTPGDTFATARLICLSTPIASFMTTENIISFAIDDFVDDIKDRMLQTRFRSYPVLDDKNMIRGFISRYHLIMQKKKQLILLDHNEHSQTVDGIDQADLLEIIDHHRIGDIQTGLPVYFKNEPVGSTATIIANIFFGHDTKLTKPIAGILCAAIISDTILFKSPTCTPYDIKTADRLAAVAGIDIDSFAHSMFKEGTEMKGRTPEQILFQDFKEYEFRNLNIGIGQVNTFDLSFLEELRPVMLDYMNKVCADRKMQIIILMVTDIIAEGSEILFAGSEKEIVRAAFNIPYTEDSYYLPTIISRKQQVFPKLSMLINQG